MLKDKLEELNRAYRKFQCTWIDEIINFLEKLKRAIGDE